MTLRTYTIGFIASILLTAASFAIVGEHLASGHQFPGHQALLMGILGLAVVQLFVQIRYFLHVGAASKVRDLATLALAAAIVVLIVGGSLWIMANLADSHTIPYNGAVAPQDEQ
jgi:cytochrome o ubiquinol oxidase subunit IV